jgi:alkylhydroperoxidase family enzyme
MAGYSAEEITGIRKGVVADPKLQALISLATELTDNKGKASPQAVDAFLSVGYTAQSLAELIGFVAIRNITNYIFSNGDFEIDFPVAAPIESLESVA